MGAERIPAENRGDKPEDCKPLMNAHRELAWLISQGLSEADIIYFFINDRGFTEAGAYDLLEQVGLEFGTHRAYSPHLLNDSITPERRKFLQELSIEK